MENFNQQQNQNFQQVKQYQEQNLQKRITVCEHCGASLEEDQLFCPECGEKVGGEERICPVCETSTTSEFCHNCGTRVIPVICPNCGKESYSDFCESCRTVINEELQQFLQQPQQEVQQLTQEEAEQIKQEIKNSITPEIKDFLKKVEEHKILLEERDYFKKRENRIIRVLGQSPYEFSEQDPEEQKIIMKAYEGLKKVLTEEKKQIEEEKRQLYEIEQKRREMQEKYENTLNEVEKDIQTAKDLETERIRKEEEKRLQQEERKRKLEEARKQREFEDRLLGKFLYIGNEYEMWLKFDSINSASSYDLCHVCGNTICCKYDVKYDLHNITLINPKVIGERDSCGFLPAVSGTNFTGNLNSDGTILNGNWKTASRSYVKVSY